MKSVWGLQICIETPLRSQVNADAELHTYASCDWTITHTQSHMHSKATAAVGKSEDFEVESTLKGRTVALWCQHYFVMVSNVSQNNQHSSQVYDKFGV